MSRIRILNETIAFRIGTRARIPALFTRIGGQRGGISARIEDRVRLVWSGLRRLHSQYAGIDVRKLLLQLRKQVIDFTTVELLFRKEAADELADLLGVFPRPGNRRAVDIFRDHPIGLRETLLRLRTDGIAAFVTDGIAAGITAAAQHDRRTNIWSYFCHCFKRVLKLIKTSLPY